MALSKIGYYMKKKREKETCEITLTLTKWKKKVQDLNMKEKKKYLLIHRTDKMRAKLCLW